MQVHLPSGFLAPHLQPLVGFGAAHDEMGYLPFGREEANLFFNVVAKRYERGSMILTSNLAFTQGASALTDDQTLVAALLDRLQHHAHIVQITGEGYRLKDKRKAGTIKGESKRD